MWPCSVSIALGLYVCVQTQTDSVHGQSLSLLSSHLLVSPCSLLSSPCLCLHLPSCSLSVNAASLLFPFHLFFAFFIIYLAVSSLLNIHTVLSETRKNRWNLVPSLIIHCHSSCFIRHHISLLLFVPSLWTDVRWLWHVFNYCSYSVSSLWHCIIKFVSNVPTIPL